MKALIKALLTHKGSQRKAREEEQELDGTTMYVVDSPQYLLYYWNSSNGQSIQRVEDVLKRIAVELLENLENEEEDWIFEGEVEDGRFNSIGYQVKERE